MSWLTLWDIGWCANMNSLKVSRLSALGIWAMLTPGSVASACCIGSSLTSFASLLARWLPAVFCELPVGLLLRFPLRAAAPGLWFPPVPLPTGWDAAARSVASVLAAWVPGRTKLACSLICTLSQTSGVYAAGIVDSMSRSTSTLSSLLSVLVSSSAGS